MKVNMDRMKGILTAGTLTGLVLMVGLVFGSGNLNNGNGGAETAVSPQIIVNPIVVPTEASVQTAPTSAVSGDANYTQQLEDAVQLMQSREAQFQAQIEAANQTILQLQDQTNAQIAAQANNQVSAPAYSEYDDDDYDDHEEYEEDDDHDDDDHDDEEYEEDDD